MCFIFNLGKKIDAFAFIYKDFKICDSSVEIVMIFKYNDPTVLQQKFSTKNANQGDRDPAKLLHLLCNLLVTE